MITSTRMLLMAGVACAAMGGRAALAQVPEGREYPCYRLAGAPAIDGKLDDGCWESVPGATGFRILSNDPNASRYAIKKQTSFRMGWTDRAVYLAVRCIEPDMAKVRSNNAGKLWFKASVELFLSPGNERTGYYQLAASWDGAQWSGVKADGELEVRDDVSWKVKPGVWRNGWTLEAMIPFDTLGAVPSAGKHWRFNLGRNILAGPESERFTCWAATTGIFGDIPNFARLVFKPGESNPETARKEEDRLNKPFHTYYQSLFVEIAKSDFEEIGGWAPQSWLNKPGGAMRIVSGGRSGRCLEVVNTSASIFKFRTSKMLYLNPNDTDAANLSCQVKGKGRFRICLYCYDNGGKFLTTSTFPRIENVDSEAWMQYDFSYDFSTVKPAEKEDIRKVHIGFLIRENSNLHFDDFRALKPEPQATCSVALSIETRNASSVKLVVNDMTIGGRENGDRVLALPEGLSVLGISAEKAGGDASLRVRVPTHPILETRWRVGTCGDDVWLKPSFDDRSWQVAEVDGDGYVKLPADLTGTVCLRQLVLWGEHYYTGLPCIQPRVQEWGFSENSLETLIHPLYTPPPLEYPLQDYEFTLDVPTEFSLLEQDYKGPYGGGKWNRRPEEISSREVERDGREYTRYTLSFKPEYVCPFKEAKVRWKSSNQLALIPVRLGAYKSADKNCQFYFRRTASGNITEIEQGLPVHVLPPINGRILENVKIQQYMGLTTVWANMGRGGMLDPEYLGTEIRQSLKAGYNLWLMSGSSWPPSKTVDEYCRRVYELVLKNGGQIGLIGQTMGYPITRNTMGEDSALGKLMISTPEARARYWNDIKAWAPQRRFCPTFALEHPVLMRQTFRTDIKTQLHGDGEKYIGYPKAEYYWLDYETDVWSNPGRHDNKDVFCFCQKCKEGFCKYANLPETADLSDDAIKENYKEKWAAFRHALDGRINKLVRETCNGLGLKYMYYDMYVHKDNWAALGGAIDIACPGLPGQDCFYGNRQAFTDQYAAWLRELGVGAPQIIGQQFAANFHQKDGVPWGAWTSRQEEFFKPRMVKLQILRTVAATRGGIEMGSAFERMAGQKYYTGEATRLIGEYEDVFWKGERNDELAESEQLDYPNLLVVRKGDERIVLLFNESEKPLTVALRNKDLKPGQKATAFYAGGSDATPADMTVTIPAQDVEAVYIK